MHIIKLITFITLWGFIQCTPKVSHRTVYDNSNNPFQKELDKARVAITQNDNDKALNIYDKILAKDIKHTGAMLGKAGIYYNLEQWDDAKSMLKKAESSNPNVNPEVYYSLGLVNENLQLYQDAINNYKQYVQKNTINSKKQQRANFNIKQLQYIDFALNHPVPYQPQLLDKSINTDDSEYWAVMSADNSSFVFTRRIDHQEDLYISQLQNDGTFIKALTMPWNTKLNEAAHCISPDGNLIIFTRCHAPDSKGNCDLYYTQFKYGTWSEPRNMGYPINSTAWDSQPSLSQDGNTLYFSSKRKGTKGSSDIFVSHLKDRKWSTPHPLGENINTKGSDESPYLHPDGQTLYFRSNGRVGMGDFDIYYSKKDPHTQKWGLAKNIGYPINTKGSDGALTVAYDGKTAYYATDYFSLKQNRKPNLDIVQFELYPEARSTPVSYAKLHIIDSKSLKPVKTLVKFYDLDEKTVLHQANTDENGDLLVSLVTGKEYMLNINEKNYSFYSEHISLSEIAADIKPLYHEIMLDPISKAIATKHKEIVLHNIFFETGSAQLMLSSMIEINNLKDYLTQSPSFKINIIGHTDNVGSDDDNLQLSQNRAKAVYDALILKGISPNRIRYEGKGESQPIADNNTVEGRKKNRRTSFVIE